MDFGIGPYYFDGYYQKRAVGAKGNLSLRMKDICGIGVIGSYDSLFHGRVQGVLNFSIPLGPKNFSKRGSNTSCPPSDFYDMRLAHGADRNEIVVVDRHQKVLASATQGNTVVAINPLTGQPYVVWFVDNTSSSSGTFENPFNTLAQAQAASSSNDLIYVYPGDGTSTGMDSGIVLQEEQQLLGAGTAVALATASGSITIPAQASSSPLITNSGSTVITLANQNVVSGVQVKTNVTGISGSSTAGVQILSCQIASDSFPISLSDFTGIAIIQNNTFSDYSGSGIGFSASSGNNQLTITSNTFTALSGASGTLGISGVLTNASTTDFLISNNSFTEHTASSMSLSSSDTSILTATLSSNHCISGGTGTTSAISVNSSGSSSLSYSASNNLLENHTGLTISSHFDGTGMGAITLANNSIVGIAGTSQKAIALDSGNTSSVSWSTTIQSNTCSGGFTQADIYLDSQGTSTLTSAVVANNIVEGASDGTSPYGIQLDADDTAIVNSLTISDNISSNHTGAEIAVTARGSAAQITTTISGNELTTQGVTTTNGIQVTSNHSSTINASITSNFCSGQTTYGVQINSNDTPPVFTATVANNTLIAPLGTANTNGISVIANGTTNSVTIANNTISQYEAFSIQINYGGSLLNCSIKENNISVGTSTGSGFGMLTLLGGTTQNIAIDNNTISTPNGGLGSQFGVVCAQISHNTPAIPQAVSLRGNTVTNCGNATPLFGFTGGIVAALENGDNLFADMESNTCVDCATSSLGGAAGVRIPAFGSPGHMCWKLANNTSNTNFALYNDPPTGTTSDFTLDASGNTGTINPVSGSVYTGGSCPDI